MGRNWSIDEAPDWYADQYRAEETAARELADQIEKEDRAREQNERR
jgi:hypothetical protein